jgi:hypothetical protein
VTTLITRQATTDPAVLNARARLFARLAVVLVCGAQLVICCLTVSLPQVDPIKDPVSDYAFYRAGRPWFAAAIVLVLLGARAITVAMAKAGLPRKALTNIFFGLWASGLLLIAVFQGNRFATDPTVHGEIHRLGGAVFLTCLPLACWTWANTLASEPRWMAAATRVRRLSAAGAVTAAAFGLAQIMPALPQGLLERLALGMELVLLVALALIVRRAAR